MNQPTGNVEREKPQQPHYKQNNKRGEKHLKSPSYVAPHNFGRRRSNTTTPAKDLTRSTEWFAPLPGRFEGQHPRPRLSFRFDALLLSFRVRSPAMRHCARL